MTDRLVAAALCLGLMVSASQVKGQMTSEPPSPPASQQAAISGQAEPEVRYIAREAYVDIPNSFPRGVDTVELYADLPGKHPLALLTHGTSSKESDREHTSPWSMYWPALWFARRGYAAVIVVRRGYGRSGGTRDTAPRECREGRFEEAGEASAEDLRAVARVVANRPEIDLHGAVSVGISTGGFAQVALTADPFPGLGAAISFAGGRGGDGKGDDCNLRALVGTFEIFGKAAAKHGSVPMLWMYAQNDHWFTPEMATAFQSAYAAGGGRSQLILAPANGTEGHNLFYHSNAWAPAVSAFLQAHSMLPLGDRVLAPPRVATTAPPGSLHEQGAEAWRRYLAEPPFKAFALDANGGWGSAAGKFDQDLADEAALEQCKRNADDAACKVVARTSLGGTAP